MDLGFAVYMIEFTAFLGEDASSVEGHSNHLQAGESFAFETTCAGRSYVPWLQECRAQGLACHSGFSLAAHAANGRRSGGEEFVRAATKSQPRS